MDKTENKNHKRRSLIYTLLFMLAVIISLSFVKFSVLQITPPTVTVQPPLPEEIEDFVIQQDKASSGGNKAEQSDPAPNNNPTDPPLADNKPDETVVPQNPGFNGAGTETYSGGGGGGGGDGGGGGGGGSGGGGGFGDPERENDPTPPDYDTDYSGNVCVELLINAQGKAISAKSCNSTRHPDQNVIKSVLDYVKKNVKYKAEEGAPNRKAFYTVYIKAG